MTSRTGKAGFALVEVLLAVTLVSIGLVAAERALLNSASLLQFVEQRSEAAQLAASKIWEIRDAVAREGRLAAGGEETLLGSRKSFRCGWRSHLVAGAAEEGSAKLYQVDMGLSWPQAGIGKKLERHFYVWIPAPPK